MPLLIGGAALFTAFGFAADQAGDASEQVGNSALKLVVVAGVGYLLLKKTKVI